MKRIVALLIVAVFVVLALASCGAKDVLGETYVLDKVTVKLTSDAKKEMKEADMTKDDVIEFFEATAVKEIKFIESAYEVDGKTIKGKLTGTEYKYSMGKVTLTIEDKDYGTVKYIYKKK